MAESPIPAPNDTVVLSSGIRSHHVVWIVDLPLLGAKFLSSQIRPIELASLFACTVCPNVDMILRETFPADVVGHNVQRSFVFTAPVSVTALEPV